MKRFWILLICSILLLTGCTAANPPAVLPDPAPSTVPEASEAVLGSEEAHLVEPESSEMLAVSVPISTERVLLDDGTELFSHASQHMELILPDAEVADKVTLDFLNRVDAVKPDAENVRLEAENDYTPDENWIPYFYQIIYSPTRIDQGVLSLFGSRSSYNGAVHGSSNGVAASYDLMTGDVLTLGSIMHMDASKEDYITLISGKLAEKAEEYQLFDGFEDGVRSRLEGDENLYEDFYFTTTGLAFFFDPYEIAPYASGMITVEIPYHELPGLIYDGYFPAEREVVTGSMQVSAFAQTDMSRFDNMANVTLTAGENAMVVYPQGIVEDIRIRIPGDGRNLPDYTAFAASKMSSQNAVVIYLQKAEADGIFVEYLDKGNTTTLFLE